MQKTIPLEPGKVYHLYNRANNREDLFRDEFDYQCFLVTAQPKRQHS